jgi:D-lactate dehydrogenase (cytochrome)
MRENVLSLECVLPDGTIAKCGTRALKSSAGYDLVSLMTGSEGTLGIITHITVKLHPVPDNVTAAVCTFDNLHDAAEAVAMMHMCAISVERCEILDESSVSAFLKYRNHSDSSLSSLSASNDRATSNNKMQIKPTLFLEFAGPSQVAVQEQVNMTEDICSDFNGSNFKFTGDEDERRSLWEARHKLYYASFALRPGAKSAIVTDACVPLSKFADVLTETVEDVKRNGVVGPCFGHAGDGNFHCILPMLDDDSDEYVEKLHQVNNNLIKRAIEVGGTCTGEHGVGYGKIKYLKEQYGKGGVEMMRQIKKGLDPNNIMNPSKVVVL